MTDVAAIVEDEATAVAAEVNDEQRVAAIVEDEATAVAAEVED